ncbi:holin [Loigolactobacillus backii]|uniref:holin n=1 Tax=Loigolactobacillus backii TaxID=375175 RepID=UPI0009EF3EA0|nr:holin [Loigolactobacillus backii]
MNIITNLNLATAAELAVIAAVSGLATQALKKITNLPCWVLPWASIIIGALGGLVAVVVTHDTNYASAALAGALTGGATSGLFDGVSGIATTVKANSDAQQAVADKNDNLQKEVDQLKNLVNLLQSSKDTASSAASSAASTAPAPEATIDIPPVKEATSNATQN